jgi:hypothetical protein
MSKVAQGHHPKSLVHNERLTSYDELFHSHLHDDSEVLGGSQGDIQVQDPTKARKLDISMASRSLLAQALATKGDGLLKRNVKNDRGFNDSVDNLIYHYQDEEDRVRKKRRMIENTIVMPMLNTKGQVIGLIQVGNSEKQLVFTEHDLDIVRLVACKIANFVTDARARCQRKALFKKQMEVSLIHSTLESQSVTRILTLANQLFQSGRKQPIQEVGYFLKKTEKYLR